MAGRRFGNYRTGFDLGSVGFELLERGLQRNSGRVHKSRYVYRRAGDDVDPPVCCRARFICNKPSDIAWWR